MIFDVWMRTPFEVESLPHRSISQAHAMLTGDCLLIYGTEGNASALYVAPHLIVKQVKSIAINAGGNGSVSSQEPLRELDYA